MWLLSCRMEIQVKGGLKSPFLLLTSMLYSLQRTDWLSIHFSHCPLKSQVTFSLPPLHPFGPSHYQARVFLPNIISCTILFLGLIVLFLTQLCLFFLSRSGAFFLWWIMKNIYDRRVGIFIEVYKRTKTPY